MSNADSANPKFGFLSKSQSVLDIIEHSPLLQLTASKIRPGTIFDIVTTTVVEDFRLENGDLAIIIIPEKMDSEWRGAYDTEWRGNNRIGTIREAELQFYLDHKKEEEFHKRIRGLMMSIL